MENNYKILEWDSQFFGYKVAYLKPWNLEPARLKEIIADMKNNGVALAYCSVNPDDEVSNLSLANDNRFLADQKITFFTSIEDEHNYIFSGNIMPYKSEYTSEKLKSLALQSGLYSRFKVDPHFVNGEFEKLYAEWIEKSVKKNISDEILVYYLHDDEKGFVSLGVKNGIGSIGLIAVDELERGKSIGKELMIAALDFFKTKKLSEVEVVTQKANYIACEFYKTLGFGVKSIENIYHLWIK